MKTYADLFQRYLSAEIAAGGDVYRMVALVNMWKRTDRVTWYYEFQNWAHNKSFTCGNCHRVFSFFLHPVNPTTDEIEEDSPVLCRNCLRL